MGVSYKGGAQSYRSVSNNIPFVSLSYDYNDGYFGEPGTGNKVRIIYSDNPISTGKDFYDKIAYGGIQTYLDDNNPSKGAKTEMADGTIITFRPKTKSDDNPGVDINITKSNEHGSLKKQKIHFEYGGK